MACFAFNCGLTVCNTEWPQLHKLKYLLKFCRQRSKWNSINAIYAVGFTRCENYLPPKKEQSGRHKVHKEKKTERTRRKKKSNLLNAVDTDAAATMRAIRENLSGSVSSRCAPTEQIAQRIGGIDIGGGVYIAMRRYTLPWRQQHNSSVNQ